MSLACLGMLLFQGRCQEPGVTHPADYADDVYHCHNPQRVIDIADMDLFTISCDPTTWRWNVDELDPDSPPTLCLGIQSVETLQEPINDWLEPCLLWAMTYGNVADLNFSNGTDTGEYLYCLFPGR